MARFSRITKKLISQAVATDDLGDALYSFQNAIGISCGGVADRVFASGMGHEWPGASQARRSEMMDIYIAAERG
ncbi:hypothetical protein [Agrobacterium tumefaciens]|uniref:hypothetical protein n=1 Tax=Agrobacterium tumefaciens TaxID=358 RepID=UPI001571B585|nr:hypothetical protein [Agrobacterium tumefaciens]NTB05953.1 hypothetical protein [Agrobacterium tumefaciens]